MVIRPVAFRLILVLLGCVASWWILKRAFPPYLWMAALWAALSAFLFVTSTGWRRVAWFNVGAVIVVLGAGEFFCWRTTPAGSLRTHGSAGAIESHEFLGNAPRKGAVDSVSRYDDGVLSFHVSYSIDSLGWRVTPWHGESEEDAAPIAFFGCSLTFGEGVPDSATLPAQVNLQSKGRFRARNFGFSGYGPHQMLAILEHRLEAPALPRRPIMAIYQAIPGHVYRTLGRTTWDPGPRYRLQPDGTVRFAGRFHTPLASKALNVLYRSFLLGRWMDIWNRRLGPRDYALYFGVVEAARREFQARYPGSDFAVIFWDTRTASPEALRMDELLLAGFARRGIRAVPVSRILPGYPREAQRYLLSRHDPHPNALAYRALAEYLIEQLLPAPPGRPETDSSPPGPDAPGSPR
ncbi:MAG: hypothetical protein ABIS67_09325 [Candidatus Eisenbacteria bacterium]